MAGTLMSEPLTKADPPVNSTVSIRGNRRPLPGGSSQAGRIAPARGLGLHWSVLDATETNVAVERPRQQGSRRQLTPAIRQPLQLNAATITGNAMLQCQYLTRPYCQRTFGLKLVHENQTVEHIYEAACCLAKTAGSGPPAAFAAIRSVLTLLFLASGNRRRFLALGDVGMPAARSRRLPNEGWKEPLVSVGLQRGGSFSSSCGVGRRPVNGPQRLSPRSSDYCSAAVATALRLLSIRQRVGIAGNGNGRRADDARRARHGASRGEARAAELAPRRARPRRRRLQQEEAAAGVSITASQVETLPGRALTCTIDCNHVCSLELTLSNPTERPLHPVAIGHRPRVLPLRSLRGVGRQRVAVE